MNRLESLQYYPEKFRRVFYFAIPSSLFLFVLIILSNFFEVSLSKIVEYVYIPAILSVGYIMLINKKMPDEADNRKSEKNKKDIEVDPIFLKKELEKSRRAIKYLVGGVVVSLVFSLFVRTSFYGQLIDLVAMLGFFFYGAYFREVLHVYSRTPGVSEEATGKYYIERIVFNIMGWLALFFFLQNTLFLKGKAEGFWSGLPTFVLVLGVLVYLFGIFGVVKLYVSRKKDLNGYFLACLTFGSLFPLAWLYHNIHDFVFPEIPFWVIQIPIFLVVFIVSIGMFFSFQSTLQSKILGNTYLYFFKHCVQAIAFIFLWKSASIYTDMNAISALAFYGVLFAAMAWVAMRKTNLVFAFLISVIGIFPFFPKMMNGEFNEAIESQWALFKEDQQKEMTVNKSVPQLVNAINKISKGNK